MVKHSPNDPFSNPHRLEGMNSVLWRSLPRSGDGEATLLQEVSSSLAQTPEEEAPSPTAIISWGVFIGLFLAVSGTWMQLPELSRATHEVADTVEVNWQALMAD